MTSWEFLHPTSNNTLALSGDKDTLLVADTSQTTDATEDRTQSSQPPREPQGSGPGEARIGSSQSLSSSR